jgi:hypothetical protein
MKANALTERRGPVPGRVGGVRTGPLVIYAVSPAWVRVFARL